MKKLIVSVLTAVAMIIGSSCYSMQELPNYYVAAFTSPEFEEQWADKYEPDLKFVYKSWKDLPKFIDKAKKEAGTRPLIIDLDVHGSEDGFFVYTGRPIITISSEDARLKFARLPKQIKISFYERASMGYIYSVVEEKLKTRRDTTVLLEACFPGNGYHTIRGNKYSIYEPYVINYSHYPKVPIYCIGSGFSNPDITMLFQKKHNIRKCWHDIREYETTIPDAPEVECNGMEGSGCSYTTVYLMYLSAFIRSQFP